jgi:hypothetical protein
MNPRGVVVIAGLHKASTPVGRKRRETYSVV